MATAGRSNKGLAILSLTVGGARLAVRLQSILGEGQLMLPRRLQEELGEEPVAEYFDRFSDAFGRAFHSYSALVCIMAAGIVVRSLAPLAVSKHLDPAVVVVDEMGRFAISLLSGHWGGANQLAARVADGLGGQAVITTATDVQGKAAVDLLASEMPARVLPLEKVKIFNRRLAEGKEVYIYSPWPLKSEVKRGFAYQPWPEDSNGFREPAVVISHKAAWDFSGREIIQIRPRNLVLGLGCRKGVSLEQVKEALDQVMKLFQLDLDCVKAMASANIKAEEPALLALARQMGIEFKVFSPEEIKSLEGSFTESAWVQEIIGVGGVCEPTALLASRGGITLVPKQKRGPVTVSVAMEKSWWWVWDQVSQSI